MGDQIAEPIEAADGLLVGFLGEPIVDFREDDEAQLAKPGGLGRRCLSFEFLGLQRAEWRAGGLRGRGRAAIFAAGLSWVCFQRRFWFGPSAPVEFVAQPASFFGSLRHRSAISEVPRRSQQMAFFPSVKAKR